MNRPPARHAPQQMTQAHNVTMALAKVGTAPLATLDTAMLISIAASACRRGTPAFERLLADLQSRVAERARRERGLDGERWG